MSGSVLLIRHSEELEIAIRKAVESLRWRVITIKDEAEALEQARPELPDMIVIDDPDAVWKCARLRDQPVFSGTLIIVIGEPSETSEVLAFTMGADDFIELPTSLSILESRLLAKARRQQRFRANGSTERRGIHIDVRSHRVLAGGQAISLTLNEFNLLRVLIQHPGRAFNRQDLVDAALGKRQQVLERTVDVHIKGLRRKLGRFADRVQTIRGVGYRFAKD